MSKQRQRSNSSPIKYLPEEKIFVPSLSPAASINDVSSSHSASAAPSDKKSSGSSYISSAVAKQSHRSIDALSSHHHTQQQQQQQSNSSGSKMDLKASRDRINGSGAPGDEKKITSFSAMAPGPAIRSTSYGGGSAAANSKARPVSIAVSTPSSSTSFQGSGGSINNSTSASVSNPSSRPISPDKVFSVFDSKSYHHIGYEETSRCAGFINEVLAPHLDPELDHIFRTHQPLPTEPGETCDDALFSSCTDGLLLVKLINKTAPGTIDERLLKKPARNQAHVAENVQVMLNGASLIGVKLSNIGSGDIIKGNRHLMLSLIWQIIKLGLLAQINVKKNPYLNSLLSETEQKDSSKINNETLLVKWVNFHLIAAGSSLKMSNFTTDLQSGDILYTLLHQLASHGCPNSEQVQDLYQQFIGETDRERKAAMIIEMTYLMDVKPLLSAVDIVKGNKDHAVAYCAQLFTKYPNLEEALSKHATSVQIEAQNKESEDVKALKQKLDESESQKMKLAHSQKETENKLASVQKKLSEKDDEIARASKKAQSLEAEKSTLQIGSKQLQDSNYALQRRIDQLELQIKELKELISKVTRERDDLADDIKKLQSNVQDAHRTRRDSVSAMNAQFNNMRNELEQERRVSKEKLQKMENQTAQLSQTADSSLRLITASIPSIPANSDLKAAVETLLENLSEANAKNMELELEISNLKQVDLPEMKRRLESTDQQLKQREKEAQSLSSNLEQANKKISDLQIDQRNTHQNYEKAKSAEKQLTQLSEQELPMLKTKLAEKDSALKLKEKELEYMKKMVDDRRDESKKQLDSDQDLVNMCMEMSKLTKVMKDKMKDKKVKAALDLKPRDLECNILLHSENLSNSISRVETMLKQQPKSSQ